jgi:hypothetical protein
MIDAIRKPEKEEKNEDDIVSEKVGKLSLHN